LIDRLTTKKRIRLTGRPWLKDAWRPNEFATLDEVLQPLKPYLEASFELRAEVTVALLMTRQFHVTYSPFVGEVLNPLAFQWLRKYAPYIQNLAVELDMTRLGFSNVENADLLPPGVLHMKKLIKGLAVALKRRRNVSTMESLILVCRRYYGSRQRQNSPVIAAFPPTAPIKTRGEFILVQVTVTF
jgi:hypothetical protein